MASLRELLDGLSKTFGGTPSADLEGRVLGYGSDPTSRMLQVDVNRNVLPGTKTPDASTLSPAELAQLDRFAWGAQAGLGGVPTALYSEAVKVPAVQGALRPVTRALGAVLGYPEAEQWYNTDETSSPPSAANVLAYLQGALSDRAKEGKPTTLATLMSMGK